MTVSGIEMLPHPHSASPLQVHFLGWFEELKKEGGDSLVFFIYLYSTTFKVGLVTSSAIWNPSGSFLIKNLKAKTRNSHKTVVETLKVHSWPQCCQLGHRRLFTRM